MKTSQQCKTKLKALERFMGRAYQCQAGRWTIGYGFTLNVKEGDVISVEDADARLDAELVDYEAAVTTATNNSATQNQFDAMILLAWNIGIPAFNASTVVKCHSRHDYVAAAKAFGLFDKYTDRVTKQKLVSEGLVHRRAVEAALYLEPDLDAMTGAKALDLPQAVDPEKPMSASTINRAGVIAGGTAAVATVTQTLQAVGTLKDSLIGLGEWMLPLLGVGTLGAVGFIIYQRFQQRAKGIA